jgi:hypothetical protein
LEKKKFELLLTGSLGSGYKRLRDHFASLAGAICTPIVISIIYAAVIIPHRGDIRAVSIHSMKWHLAILPALVLTFPFGPLGFLIYLGTR